MLKPQEIAELSLMLWYLPLERVAALKKTVLAYKQECGYAEPTDDSDEWTREDELELAQASLSRMAQDDLWSANPANEMENKDAKAG